MNNEELLCKVLDFCTTTEHLPPLSDRLKRRITNAWVRSIDKAIQVGWAYYQKDPENWDKLELTPIRAAEKGAKETLR